MRIKDPRTGEEAFIADVDGYCRENAALWRKCECARSELRRWTNSNGALAAQLQCFDCGARVGNPQGMGDKSGLPPADPTIAERYQAARKQAHDAVVIRYIDLAAGQDDEFWAKYDAYLKTPEWRALRAKVLKRCGGICEGCGERKATQAHHLTYAHVFNEFLFELVGICHQCHERAHHVDEEGKAAPQPELEDEFE